MSSPRVREVCFEQADHSRRESLVDEQSVAGVPRRVGHDHDLAPHVHSLLNCGGFEEGDSALFHAKGFGIKRFTCCRSACLVIDQNPGPSSSVVQWTGSSTAQHSEHLMMFHSLKAVEIGEVAFLRVSWFPL